MMPSITIPLTFDSVRVDLIHSRSHRPWPASAMDSFLGFFGLVRLRFVPFAMEEIWLEEERMESILWGDLVELFSDAKA